MEITREQAIEAVHRLGLDENHVREVTIDSRGVTVTRFVVNSDGTRFQIDGGRYAYVIDRHDFYHPEVSA